MYCYCDKDCTKCVREYVCIFDDMDEWESLEDDYLDAIEATYYDAMFVAY